MVRRSLSTALSTCRLRLISRSDAARGAPAHHLRAGAPSSTIRSLMMPLYDYNCSDCGPFEAITPLARSSDPCACPDCEQEAPRAILHAPQISSVSGAIRKAHETNERSADSPKRSSHGPGCGCCGGGSKENRSTLHRADGSKSFPTKRPWMISH